MAIIPCTPVQARPSISPHAVYDVLDGRVYAVTFYGNLQKLAVSGNIQGKFGIEEMIGTSPWTQLLDHFTKIKSAECRVQGVGHVR